MENKDLRAECMLSAQLLKNSLEQMEDIMKIAEMENAPEHTGKLLYAQADIATDACEKLESLKKKYESTKEVCGATMLHLDEVIEDYEEMKEDYQEFKNERGGNPY